MAVTQPLVSVIIPAYKAADVIGEAIQSILDQTYRNLEIIIIDDCSPDTTWDIIQSYAQKDTRIVAHKNAQNMGIGGNRAKGIELARSEFICWQDADDISTPDRIEKQVTYLQEHPKVGVVGGFIEFFGGSEPTSIRKYAEHDAQLRQTIFRYNPVAQPASMFRKECYTKLGVYDPALTVSEDLDMLFRVGTQYEFANVQSLVLHYRQVATSLTRKNLKKMELTTIKLRRKYAKDAAYHPTVIDYIFNVVQYVSVYLVPPTLKIKLFTMLRNSK